MASRACPLGFAPARSAVLDASRVARSHLEGTTVAPSLAEAWAKISLPSLSPSLPSVATHSNFPTSNKLKGLVRLGVPHEVRPSLWFLLSGGHSLSEQAEPGTYARLSTSTSDLSRTMLLADTLNLSLTWRPHPAFQNPDFAAATARILIALLAHNPCLNYSRHLCHVTAFLLLVFGGVQHEEPVFYTLAAMMDKLLFPHVNGQWATGTRIEATVLDRLAARKLRHLASHLATLDLSVASLAAPWLSSLFVGVLPSIPLLRVWDCMLCEGLKMVQRTGLALLLMCEKPLTSCSHPDVLRRVVALRVGGITSADKLLATAFRGVRSFPGAAITAIRSDATREVSEGSGQGRDRLAKVSDGSSGLPCRSARFSAGGNGGSSPSGVSATPSRDVSPRSSFGSALVRWRSSRDNPASASSPALHAMTPSAGDASPLVSAGGLSPDRRGVARMSGRVRGEGANSGASQNGFAQLLGAALAPFRSGGERVFTQSTSATNTSLVVC